MKFIAGFFTGLAAAFVFGTYVVYLEDEKAAQALHKARS